MAPPETQAELTRAAWRWAPPAAQLSEPLPLIPASSAPWKRNVVFGRRCCPSCPLPTPFVPHIVPGHRSSRGHFRSPRGVLPGLGMTCATGTLRALSGQPPSSGFILELLSSPSRPPPSPLAPSSVPKALLTSSLLSSSPRYLGHPPLPSPQIIASWVEARGSNLAGSTCAATPAPGKALPRRTSPCLSHLLLLLRSLKPTRFLSSWERQASWQGCRQRSFAPDAGAGSLRS